MTVQFNGYTSPLRNAWYILIISMATYCGLNPLMSDAAESPAAASTDDVIVRIHYQGGAATFSSLLTLSRIGGRSKVEYKVENAIVAIPRPNAIYPTMPWAAVWKGLYEERFFDLQGEGRDQGCPKSSPQVIDADVVTVEIERDSGKKRFTYSYPPGESCGATQRLLRVLSLLQKAFGDVLPIPKGERSGN